MTDRADITRQVDAAQLGLIDHDNGMFIAHMCWQVGLRDDPGSRT